MVTGSRRAVLAALLLVLGTAGWALASSSVPPSEYTGSPAIGTVAAEPTCVTCHGGHPLNNGNGSVEILGLPDFYTPGQTYDLTVQVASTSTAANSGRRWSFEITAFRAATGLGTGAGTFTVPSELRLRLQSSKARQYVGPSSAALRTGQASPASWTFQWTAPDPATGTIDFAVVGNAANGTGSTSGDYIYAAADSAAASPVPVQRVSWGAIKSRLGG